jgi:hypothetical protein
MPTGKVRFIASPGLSMAFVFEKKKNQIIFFVSTSFVLFVGFVWPESLSLPKPPVVSSHSIWYCGFDLRTLGLTYHHIQS